MFYIISRSFKVHKPIIFLGTHVKPVLNLSQLQPLVMKYIYIQS